MSCRRICEANPSGIISLGAHPRRVPALTGSKRTSCELRLQRRGAKDFAAANTAGITVGCFEKRARFQLLKASLPSCYYQTSICVHH